MLTSEILSGWPAWAQPLLAPWWTAWGVPVSYLEALAFVALALDGGLQPARQPLGLALGHRQLAAVRHLVAQYGLYGEAGLQLVFVVMAVWGWWQVAAGR